MSTLSSWIDPDEISELMPILLPDTGKEEGEPPSPPVESEGNAEEGVEALETSEPTGVSEPAPETDTRTETPPEEEEAPTAEEAATESTHSPGPDAVELPSGPQFNFNASDAYDASPFPEESVDATEESSEAARQTAAVQAAETLERVRSRANEGGLLRSADESAAAEATSEPAIEPPVEATPEPEPEAEISTAPEDPVDEKPEPAPQSPEGDAIENEADKTDDSPTPPPPGSFRDRLARFAASAIDLTGGSEPVITDLQSYPLHLPATGKASANAQSIGAIVRMNQQIAEMPNQPNGGSARTSQIALSPDEWLCILTQGSAAGETCASFRVAEPLSSEIVETLHGQLRAAIDG